MCARESFAIFVFCLWILQAAPARADVHYSYHAEKDTRILQALIDPPNSSQNPITWMGADIASSAPIGKGKYTWIFGDTIVGTTLNRSRTLMKMTHNSIGITSCYNAHCNKIQKFNTNSSGHPSDIIFLDDRNQYYWPSSGIRLKNKFFFTGYTLKKAKNITIVGTTFVLVDNPDSPPSKWKYQTYFLPHTSEKVNFATAIVKRGKWLYVFGESKPAMTVLLRISMTDAELGNWKNIEFFSHPYIWTSNIKSLAPITGLPATSEMSLDNNDYFGWYTVHIAFLSHDVHLYTADKLIGPWVDQGIVYTITLPSNNHFFAYNAKAHPELAKTKNQLVFTYNINQFDFSDFIKNINNQQYWRLYIPQFVIVDTKKIKSF